MHILLMCSSFLFLWQTAKLILGTSGWSLSDLALYAVALKSAHALRDKEAWLYYIDIQNFVSFSSAALNITQVKQKLAFRS